MARPSISEQEIVHEADRQGLIRHVQIGLATCHKNLRRGPPTLGGGGMRLMPLNVADRCA